MSRNASEDECDCPDHSDGSDDDIERSAAKLKTKGVKRRKKVLDEDLYVDQIERIIERDFFPDLAKLREQMEKRTVAEEVRFCPPIPSDRLPSPSTFETPIRETNRDEDQIDSADRLEKDNKQEEDTTELNLDQFFNKYTSEDNASFVELQEQELRKHKIKYKWLHKDGHKHNKHVKQMLELPTIERQAIEAGEGTAAPITWPYVNHNSVMFNPSGMAVTEYKDIRPEVVHSNTRFQSAPFNERVNQMTISLAAQLNARQKEGKIGIDGKELVSKDTPQVNGFKFVASTPTPAPEFYSESPLMTWGEIAATPLNLSASDTPLHPGLTPGASQFKIPDLPEREKIGLSLATRTAKLHRDRKKKAIQAIQTVQSAIASPFQPSKTPFERLNSMSPAAQLLAKSKLGFHRNADRTLMASYSPARTPNRTPTRTPVSTPKSLRSTPMT